MRVRNKPTLVAALFAATLLGGCNKPYRVGEYVWVEWEQGRVYPAYIIEQKSKTRFRVHFEGYDARWDETVNIDRIRGRVEGPATHPPPPARVARAAGVSPQASGSAVAVSHYKVGDRVRVRWRGSTYSATVTAVVAADQYRVHYDGYETAWDDTVHMDRIVGRR
jgi:hypothetical protein